jgi:DNA-binding transcriptional regulator PaaX
MDNRNKKDLQGTILRVIGAVGIMAVAVLAPNAIQILGIFDKNKKRQCAQNINKSRNKLIEKGLVEKNKAGFLRLTKKGERYLAVSSIEQRQQRKWDKKWRVLVFDIPETRKSAREQVRNMLIRIGFTRLQDSVWVYPYDCSDLLDLLRLDLDLGKYLVSITAESIENDASLRKLFNLGV